MIALIQRVSEAIVRIEQRPVATIGRGVLALIGIERGDAQRQADRLLERLLAFRLFPDSAGRMNLNLREAGGGLLLVPQFTLAADTHRGTRPGFSTAAAPVDAERLFGYLLQRSRAQHARTAAGRFGATMQLWLVNDGPVTFSLTARPPAPPYRRDRSRSAPI